MVETNQDREFLYKRTAQVKDNTFEFTLPYSTQGELGWLDNSTRIEVFARPYVLKYKNEEKKIDVSEKEIMDSLTIEVVF